MSKRFALWADSDFVSDFESFEEAEEYAEEAGFDCLQDFEIREREPEERNKYTQ
jgi:hypothetical protein